ncbi:hypothetical protein QC763_120910, partial [Podospora pseudopauciseta]
AEDTPQAEVTVHTVHTVHTVRDTQAAAPIRHKPVLGPPSSPPPRSRSARFFSASHFLQTLPGSAQLETGVTESVCWSEVGASSQVGCCCSIDQIALCCLLSHLFCLLFLADTRQQTVATDTQDRHHTTQLTSNSLLTLALRRLQSSAAGPKEGKTANSRTRNNRIIEAANLLLRQTPPFPSSLSSPFPVLPRAGPCRTVQVLFLYPLRRPRDALSFVAVRGLVPKSPLRHDIHTPAFYHLFLVR